ncbi:MAG: hypothetical protein ABFR75_02590 [Acidobacteriota bacterium]
MKKESFLKILIIFFLLTSYCSRISYKSTPDTAGTYYYSVLIRAKVKQKDQKEKVKILLKYNDKGDNLIFLGPLNQILFETIIISSKTKMIIPKKKKYWEGKFSRFMKNMWGINTSYRQLKDLLLNKIIPKKTEGLHTFDITIKEPGKKGISKVIISDKTSRLEFRIYPIKKREGGLILNRDLGRYNRISLEEFHNDKKGP